MKTMKKIQRVCTAAALTGVLLLSGCQGSLSIGTNPRGLKTAEGSTVETMTVIPASSQLEKLAATDSSLELKPGEEGSVRLSLHPSEGAVYHLIYTSEDETVCTVQQDGTILAAAEGETEIRITDTFSGQETSLTVTVRQEVLPTGIQTDVTELSLTVGDETAISATVLPDEAENPNLLWSSSDEAVATVSDTGTVTAAAAGQCTITIQAEADETVTAEVAVTVAEQSSSGGSSSGGSSSGGSSSGGSSSGGSSSGDSSSGGSSSGGSSSDSSSSGSSSSASAAYMDSYAEQVLTIVNARRAEAGLSPLTMNYTAVSAAKVRAAETVQSFSHTRPNGTSCFTALNEAGVSYMICGENIAAGQRTPDSVMTAWMNSEGHRANILSSAYTQIGIACYYDPNSAYGYYWVQCFIN